MTAAMSFRGWGSCGLWPKFGSTILVSHWLTVMSSTPWWRLSCLEASTPSPESAGSDVHCPKWEPELSSVQSSGGPPQGNLAPPLPCPITVLSGSLQPRTCNQNPRAPPAPRELDICFLQGFSFACHLHWVLRTTV